MPSSHATSHSDPAAQRRHPTKYDEVPYESNPYPQSHPDRLVTLARIFGLSPAPVDRSRILELGCASGGNIIPMACQLPGSRFVGVDLSTRQIDIARQTISALALENICAEQADIMEIDIDWGKFDYIICHGVYSWVPEHVQSRILDICSRNLDEDGIAYISYNTYPGWHMREIIRDMMLFHADRFEETGQKIEQARAVVDFFAGAIPREENPYGMLLKNELDLIRQCSDAYLFHDHMETVNTPVYFHQFMAAAGGCALQYLGEADFSAMLNQGFNGEVTKTLDRITHDLLELEQYMDFLKNRMFRQTLLCHNVHRPRRDLGAEALDGLLVASSLGCGGEVIELAPNVNHAFVAPNGATVETGYPITKAALGILGQHWPRAMDIQMLYTRSREQLKEQEQASGEQRTNREILCQDLLHCYTVGAVEFHTWQADYANRAGEYPCTSPLARWQAAKGATITNQRHEGVHTDPVVREVIRTLDGEKDRRAVADHLAELIAGGELAISPDKETPNSADGIRKRARQLVDEALAFMARNALLIK